MSEVKLNTCCILCVVLVEFGDRRASAMSRTELARTLHRFGDIQPPVSGEKGLFARERAKERNSADGPDLGDLWAQFYRGAVFRCTWWLVLVVVVGGSQLPGIRKSWRR